MNYMQIALKLAMDCLEVDVCAANYREICNLVYQAEQRGVYISPSRVLWDDSRQMAYSPLSHESGGALSWNLLCDVDEIERELVVGIDESFGWELDKKSLEILASMRNVR